jgi:hypothetical protein
MRVAITTAVETDVPEALIREALLDFSERRLVTWSKTLDPASYVVHSVGATTADVTEGNRWPRVWSREEYDWSTPGRISWTSRESNFCRPGSFIAMDIRPLESGGSRVTVTWDRTAANLRGRLWLLPAKLLGPRLLSWATHQALEQIRAADLAPRP